MNNITKSLQILDYTTGIITLGYGLYAQNVLVIGLGITGLVLAYLDIAGRISAFIRKKFLRKKDISVTPAPPDEDEVALQLLESTLSELKATTPTPNYGQAQLVVSHFKVGPSRHNLLNKGLSLQQDSSVQFPDKWA